MARRPMGSGTTDSNGRITVSYTGKGAGKLQLVATQGNLLSETYELIDAAFFDDGVSVSGGQLYYTSPTTEVSRVTDNDGTLVTNLTSSIKTVRVNKPDTSADEKDWEENLCIEFDLVSFTGILTLQLWKSNVTGDYVGLNLSEQMGQLTSAHLRLEFNGNAIVLFVNGTQVVNSNFSFVNSGLLGIRLLLPADASFKYKNFIVYPTG